MIKDLTLPAPFTLSEFRQWVFEAFSDLFRYLPNEGEVLAYYHFKDPTTPLPTIMVTSKQYQHYLSLLKPEERPEPTQVAHFMGFPIEVYG